MKYPALQTRRLNKRTSSVLDEVTARLQRKLQQLRREGLENGPGIEDELERQPESEEEKPC